jgi:hypothetical protein
MTNMTSARALALALAVAAGSAAAANAQTAPWPTDAPQAQQPSPWPGSAPTQPIAAPAGPMMGGPAMPPPNATQQQCLEQFTEFRSEVEKRAMAAKTASEKHVTRDEMCKLVTAYSGAEAKWIKFSDDNMARCGIPKQAIEQIKSVHVHTADARKKICAAGPAQAGPATPTLSDALGTVSLPNQETEKRKPGGTLDTLTGNALSR